MVGAIGVFAGCGPAKATGALITEVRGQISPRVQAFDEVVAGTVLTVGAGASLTLEHYRTCESVTVTAGIVEVLEIDLDLRAATIAAREHIACSSVVDLPGDLATPTVVLRAPPPPRIALKPSVIVPGAQEAGFRTFRVEDPEGRIVEMDIRGSRVAWPDTFSLRNGVRYITTVAGLDKARRAEIVGDQSGTGRLILRSD